jgi:cyclic pyranopterin phosphate synthase
MPKKHGDRKPDPDKGKETRDRQQPELSHIDAAGRIRMVDVSDKPLTFREAVAAGRIRMSSDALKQVRAGALRKGDPLETARLAGVMAAKQTATLIPLCHPLPISHVDLQLKPMRDGYSIEARVRTTAQTGVEMEALTAVSVAALTVYDMVKAVDKGMVIDGVRLLEKRGGRSGVWRSPSAASPRAQQRVPAEPSKK